MDEIDPHPPLLKIRSDIFKKGVVEEQEEEKEDGELDTSVSSSDECPSDESPPRKEKGNVASKRKMDSDLIFFINRIVEKRVKIAQLEVEIAADKLEIDRIKKLKAAHPNQRFCELCNTLVPSVKQMWQIHLNGKKHQKRELEVGAERECYIVSSSNM